MEATRALVTGGAGFIGSHVVPTLLAAGWNVRVVDDLSTGKRENLPADAEFLKGTITDAGVRAEALGDVVAVVHLAAVASVQRSVERPLATHDVNLRATIGLASDMLERGITRLVYASSAAVYGATRRDVYDENDAPAPTTPYGIDKYAGEMYLRFFRDTGGLDPRILRFFNVYGPRQDPHSPYSGVISIFATQLLHGRPLTVFGDGRQTRDFVYVRDVADVVVRHVRDSGASSPDVMNVCTGHATSLHELVGALGRFTGGPRVVRHAAARPGDIPHSLGAPNRMRAWSGFDTATSLVDGLAATIAWMESGQPPPVATPARRP